MTPGRYGNGDHIPSQVITVLCFINNYTTKFGKLQ